jgi:hypothetical protein
MRSSRRLGSPLYGHDLTRCFTEPRPEFVELLDLRASGDDAPEHIYQIFLRIDSVEFRRVDVRRDRECGHSLS